MRHADAGSDKNPLADPYVLGISSGASAGAVSVIILGLFSFLGGYSVIFGATLGAAVAIGLSLSIASLKGRITSTQLVLAGIATSALFLCHDKPDCLRI